MKDAVCDFEQDAYEGTRPGHVHPERWEEGLGPRREEIWGEYKLFAGASRGTLVASRGRKDVDVVEHIKAAPVAYLKFCSKVALVLFVFSLGFFYLTGTILVNPLFAVLGAIGSIFCWLLASVSSRLLAKEG